MKNIICAAAVVLGLGGAGLTTTSTPSMAGVLINLNLADIAVGYQDGYWDNNHRWHDWRSADEKRHYRANREHRYNNWKRNDKHHRGYGKNRNRHYESRRDHGHHNGWKR